MQMLKILKQGLGKPRAGMSRKSTYGLRGRNEIPVKALETQSISDSVLFLDSLVSLEN